MKRATTLAPLLLALAALAGCAINPVSGSPELVLVSEDQAKQLGADADQQIVAQYGLLDDPELVAYVEGVGQSLVKVSHRPDLGYTFRVLDDPLVNAFALPGGYVYLTRGILPYLQSEAGMAGVLGHEIGHITARHGVNRMSKQLLLGGVLGLAGLFSETVAQFGGLLGAAGQLLLLKYTRDQERQSDQLGVEYGTQVGYDTRDMAEFFNTLNVLSEGQRPLSWFSTHPDPGERFETIVALTQEEQVEVGRPEYVIRREEFVRRLDGLAFGPNPREGYAEGGRFLHPDLKLQFPVPEGWQVQNGKDQVLLVGPEEAALSVFGLAEGATPQAAAQAFAQGEGIEVRDQQELTINGFPAVRLLSVAQGEQGPVALLSTFVQKDGKVFVFHGLTAPEALDTWRGTLTGIADGFSELTDPAALNRAPIRLKVIEVTQPQSFRAAIAAYPIPPGADVDVAGLALMNGLPGADAPVPAGAVLKVLVN